jgi:phosphatidylglycerophosphate synthase
MNFAILTTTGYISKPFITLEGFLTWMKIQIQKLSMPMAQWFHDLGVKANHMTATRLLFPLPIALLLANGHTLGAIAATTLAAWTDVLDGLMSDMEKEKDSARSKAWGLFDSIVDKIFVISTLIIIARHGNVAQYLTLIAAISFGEATLFGFAILGTVYGYMVMKLSAEEALARIQSNSWGKSKMACELLTIGLIMGLPLFPHWTVEYGAYVFGWTAFFFLVCSFFAKLKTVLA